MNIEVEVRSFLTQEQYDRLLTYFREKAKLLKEDEQETIYYDTKQDLRIQRNNFYAKIWMKKGKLHDDHREEIEVRMKKEDFETLQKLFEALGYTIAIKWFRKRIEFLWEGITVCIDDTMGYGMIIELEKMSTKADKEVVAAKLKEKLASLNITLTPKEEFEKRFKQYREHWKELVNKG